MISLIAATVLGSVAPSSPPMTLLYDYAPALRTVVSPKPTGTTLSPTADNLVQQGPATDVLGPGHMAGKVSSRIGSQASPPVRGLSAAALARLLRREIDQSSAHIVFVDEASGRVFRGHGGRVLADAMRALAKTPYPADGTYASHVHAYVYDTSAMIRERRARSATWSALSRMGGVWLETFTSKAPAVPWDAETWRTRPKAFADVFSSRGGDLTRLHFLMTTATPTDQGTLWNVARSGSGPGSPCAILANGVGAYRVSAIPGSLGAWVREYRRVFPANGVSVLRCDGP